MAKKSKIKKTVMKAKSAKSAKKTKSSKKTKVHTASHNFAKNLTKVLVAKGLSQSTFAAEVNLTRASVSQLSSGTRNPRLNTAYRVAKALGLTINDMVRA